MDTEEKRLKIKHLALNGVMLAIILALQMINMPNIITGIIVNAVFIFVTIYAGINYSFILCILSPLVGIVTGHVIAPMYPVLPVIALGNIALVVLYNKFKSKKIWLRCVMPSLIKAIIIGGIGWLVINYFVPENLAYWVVLPVLGVQFFTAIPGVWLGEKLREKIK